jgi:alcohol dehydrogenase class IV
MAFELFPIPHILFGAGESRRLPDLAAPLGNHALILHNGRALDRLQQGLDDINLLTTPLRQSGEPTAHDVNAATELARSAGCDCVIGIGGGSAIDAAKAVAGLLTNGGQAVDYMEVVGHGKKITKPAAPWLAIPTTAGTGAEVTRNAVIGLPEKNFKASIRSEHLLPKAVIVDPELALDVPPDVTASSGMDALCQLIEAYTSTNASYFTDGLIFKVLSDAATALPRAYRDGRDLKARAHMALAALYSGIALTNAGLGAVHGFAAPLGANFPAPHGTICATLLPHILRQNISAARAMGHSVLDRYGTIGLLLSHGPSVPWDDAIDRCVTITEQLVRELRIPPLSTFGLTESQIPEMVALARKASSMRYNPVTLSDGCLATALRNAMRGTPTTDY